MWNANSPFQIHCEGVRFDARFRAEIVGGGKVFLELQSVEQLAKVYSKQLFTCLEMTEKRFGLLR